MAFVLGQMMRTMQTQPSNVVFLAFESQGCSHLGRFTQCTFACCLFIFFRCFVHKHVRCDSSLCVLSTCTSASWHHQQISFNFTGFMHIVIDCSSFFTPNLSQPYSVNVLSNLIFPFSLQLLLPFVHSTPLSTLPYSFYLFCPPQSVPFLIYLCLISLHVVREKFLTEIQSPRYARLRDWHHERSARALNIKS